MITPIILATLLVPGATTGPGRSAEVRSLLAAKCYACHGPDAEARKAQLRLDTEDGQRRDRRNGPAVDPAHPDGSLLLQRVTHANPDERMPPDAPPLDDAEIALLRTWIEAGAPWPKHWAWEPITNPSLPTLQNTDWGRDPLDAFVLARLEAADLSPADDTDTLAWLRRVYFDLVGLPPSPETVDAFLAESALDPGEARERIVDQLLASPHFGEHWGRHWLDLVRYAETCGHEFDYPIPHAWRYRDWVIRAFNTDVPYDRFVVEHVAGDLVSDPRIDPSTGLDDSIPATGFWHFSQGTHAPVDVRQDEADRIANQLDVFGKAFSALTISCARCHDHKFDPIPARDYYALNGYLQSSRRRNAYLDPSGRIESQLAQVEAQRRSLAQSLCPDVDVPERPSREDPDLIEAFDEPLSDWFIDGQAFTDPLPAGTTYLQDDTLQVASSGLLHSGIRSPRAQGTIRSGSFPITQEWLHHRVKGRGARIRVVIDGFVLNEYNPLLFEDCLKNIENESWHHVAQKIGKYPGHVAWIEYSDEGDGWIAIDEVRLSDTPDEPTWSDREDLAVPAHDASQLQSGLESIHAAEADLVTPVRVLAMTDGTPEDEHVFIRGEHANLGPIAPRMAPGLLNTATATPRSGSGRLELAEALLAESNPLTARVMVNRAWHHLFGRGIVESVDDFGAMGRPPTHPLLLDHLAVRFRSDWSIKHLLRDIVLSRTYAMSSNPNPEAMQADPGNRLLHHKPLKRLTAESIRDAMLTSAGSLDPAVGGPPIATHLTDYMTGRGRPAASGPLDGDDRRSIYLEVRRNFLSPMLLAFDLPLPTETAGRRSVSNVPAQALILMNDPFVQDQSSRWADRVLTEEDPVRSMYRSAFGRDPSPEERQAAEAFVQEQVSAHRKLGDEHPERAGWADLGHALFNTKEFIYLR